MKSRKKFLRKLLVFCLAWTLASVVYVHFGVLPGKARLYAIQKINALSGKSVTFDKALYLPFHGIIFYHLHVSEKSGKLLFSAGRYALDIKILPFLTDKKIVVNNIYLDSPVYDLVLETPKSVPAMPPLKTEISGQIRVPTVQDARPIRLEDVSGGPDAFLPENVYIEQIQINDGRVTVRKNAGSPPLETIQKINVRMAFQKPPELGFDGTLALGENPYATVDLQGIWDLKKAAYHFNLTTDWSHIPSWLKDYQKDHFLVLEEGQARLVTELRSVGETRALFHVLADLKDAVLHVHRSSYRGRMHIDAKGLFNFDTKVVERYLGHLDLVDVHILDLTPKIQSLDHITGRVDFQPDLLTLKSVKGSYKDVPFDARGTLRSFRDLNLDGEVHTDVSLEKILRLIPAAQKEKLENFEIQGDCEALTTLKGSLRSPFGISAEHKISLRRATVTSHDQKIRLVGLFCDLYSGKEGLKISSARFEMGKKIYRADLWMPKSAEEPGTLSLSSKDMRLDTGWRLNEDRIVIENAHAKLPGIEARFSGFLYPLEKPALDVRGQADLDLAQVTSALSGENAWLRDAHLEGSLQGAFTFRGAWDDLLRSQVTLTAQSPWVRLWQKMRMEHTALGAELKNGILNVTHLAADAYGGMLGLKGSLNFAAAGTPFDTTFYLNNMDLKKLALDLAPENKKLAGTLMLQSSLRGFLKNQESFSGHGAMSVKNGLLWETSQFKAMGELPLVKVEGLDWVTFREAAATFDIHDKKFWTRDLALSSDTVHLALNGSLAFNQDLDMLMDIEYTSAVFLGAQDAGGIVPMVVNQAANLISQYKISGTLKNPRYEKAGLPIVGTAGKKIGGLLGSLTS